MWGLSRNKVCIGVAVDVHETSLCLDEGLGKTSRKRTWDAFGGHIERRFEHIHDKEKSHAVLAKRLNLESKAYDAKKCCTLPDRDNCLEMVNQECNLLKSLLRSHSGFRAADI
ncbi:hypothetical protein [Atopobium sp. oral taxon 416]|uniref:hypothetical protein n=1 Tax=Atopobium sp. oral taxon 416 TaxID=712157 RepID=UPI001BA894DB|nr:hypothetical protein [Atopobium sp. oral taxon 416]QUC02581.1 hypothetical protein J4859_11120 [Atopobium sp. oral taxon 416]